MEFRRRLVRSNPSAGAQKGKVKQLPPVPSGRPATSQDDGYSGATSDPDLGAKGGKKEFRNTQEEHRKCFCVLFIRGSGLE